MCVWTIIQLHLILKHLFYNRLIYMYIKLKTVYYTIINTKTTFHAYKNKNK